ncbi:acyl-CoA dehydrogenase family protein [Streptomyces himastatinicus]|uniref:acyl-CoA dehydrogenase family protein n=1 Tax=Streptomyces himastatinicus TaxID=998084 RepID=UPI001FE05A7C|nr:acyl-CoA dehydrogenase family protein [Streptomyces himastatinicus]
MSTTLSPPATHEQWLATAREVAAGLARDAVERDRANRPPHDEAARLRDAGLLTLLIPAERGGGGADWRTAYAVIREIAAVTGRSGNSWATTTCCRGTCASSATRRTPSGWSAPPPRAAGCGAARSTRATRTWCSLPRARGVRASASTGGRRSPPAPGSPTGWWSARPARTPVSRWSCSSTPSTPVSYATTTGTTSGSGCRPAAAWSSTRCRWRRTTSWARSRRTTACCPRSPPW